MSDFPFDSLLEQAPIGFTRVNLDGEITFANKAAREILDIPLSISKFCYNSEFLAIKDVDGTELPPHKYPFNLVKAKKACIYGMKMAFKRDNGLSIISVDGCPIFQDHTIIEYVFVFHDITMSYLNKRELLNKIAEFRFILKRFE